MNKRVAMLFGVNLLCIIFSVSFVFAAPADIPKTGQTVAYTAGDDGDLQAGVTWPVPRFTLASSGTCTLHSYHTGTVVTDELTGLMWPQKVDTVEENPCCIEGLCYNSNKIWSWAVNYLACLNNITYLGFSDWRLPSIKELKSLTHAGEPDTHEWLNRQGFLSTPGQVQWYWTGTSAAGDSSQAWAVNMGWGTTYTYGKAGNIAVRPVRAGSGEFNEDINIVPYPRFTPIGADGFVVVDQLTSLMWTQDGGTPTVDSCPGGILSWQDALAYVSCLNIRNYLGYNDWRLPNRNEQESLVNFSQSNIASWLTTTGFTNVHAAQYWTATVFDPSAGGSAWCVDMYVGGRVFDVITNNHYVWPVRAGQADSFKYLTVTNSGIGTGSVTVDRGALIWSGNTGTASYGTAMTVNLVANPDCGTTFTGWSGDCTGTGDCQVTMDASKNVIATFAAPVSAVSTTEVSFAGQVVNTTSDAILLTVSNIGTAPLIIDSITKGGTNPGQFSLINICPIGGEGLAAGASCTIKLKFKPTTGGTKSALLLINVAACADSQVVPLTGIGLAPIATVSPLSLSFADQAVGTISDVQNVTVRNTGNLPLVITSISKGGTNPSQFSVINITCPIGGAGLAAGFDCKVKVKFLPTTVGTKSATVVISVETPAESKTVTLSGTGI